MVLLQECRIEILCPVAEGIEAEHQYHQENKCASVSQDVLAQASLGSSRYLALQPCRSLIHFRANVNHQECRQRADDEHPAPSRKAEYRSVNQGRHQIAYGVAFL